MGERLTMEIPSISEINQKVFDNVEGWVGPRVHQILEFFQTIHKEFDVTGDIVEIGIHHGMFFFMLAGMIDHSSTCFAIDIFENQEINIDNSGQGSRVVFEDHIKNHFPFVSKITNIIQKDSLAISPLTSSSLLSNKVKIFSVDGGHTVMHVVNDLSISQEVLLPFGVAILDDFLGPHWPSVTEGFFRYMNFYNRRLAPLIIFQNKLFITTYSEHHTVFERAVAHVKEHFHSEAFVKWRIAELCGFKVLCYSE